MPILLVRIDDFRLNRVEIESEIHHNKHKRQPFDPITVHCQKQFP